MAAIHTTSDFTPLSVAVKSTAAVRDGDTVQIKNQGHTVKGAARNISAQALQETAWQIEMAGREGQISNASALLPLLSEQFQALAKEIREFIG